MYRGFNLKLDDNFAEAHYDRGKSLFINSKAEVRKTIDSFLDGEGILIAEKMKADWFPQIKADIFISHSHSDERLAISLGAWLEITFGIKSFIDSCVWGYASDLLKLIDDKYCKNPGEQTYSYEKRNLSTSHVHMMLTTALSKMIDRSECIIFLNTPNSIRPNEVVKTETQSPWIYSEIAITSLVRRRERDEHRKRTKAAVILEYLEKYDLAVKYDLNLSHLTDIDTNSLETWKYEQGNNGKEYPLDTLYELNVEGT